MNVTLRRLKELKQAQRCVSREQLLEIELEQLITPSWLLRPINQELVNELERTIKTAGLLQPIVVRMRGNGYEIVFGNHRVEACRRLGLKQVRAIVRDFSDEEAFLARVSENLLRNSYVDPLEEAKGYRMLLDRGWTINAIGQRVGKCDSYVCERLAMLKRLSEDLHSQVSNGKLTASHAEVLSRIKDKERQKVVAELVRKNRLSVRSLENMLKDAPPPSKIRIESTCNQPCVRIPSEFANAIGLYTGREVFLYTRGNKLIIESAVRCRTRQRRLPSLIANLQQVSEKRHTLEATINS
jgi:ParB family chromosome partitioning protein